MVKQCTRQGRGGGSVQLTCVTDVLGLLKRRESLQVPEVYSFSAKSLPLASTKLQAGPQSTKCQNPLCPSRGYVKRQPCPCYLASIRPMAGVTTHPLLIA